MLEVRRLAATSVKELVALVKAKPNAFNFSSGGAGTPNHLASELFKSAAGLSFQVADDPTLAGYILASTANDDRLKRAVKITLPSGAVIYYNAYISLNKTPSLTVNSIMAVEVTLSLLAEPVRYAS